MRKRACRIKLGHTFGVNNAHLLQAPGLVAKKNPLEILMLHSALVVLRCAPTEASVQPRLPLGCNVSSTMDSSVSIPPFLASLVDRRRKKSVDIVF